MPADIPLCANCAHAINTAGTWLCSHVRSYEDDLVTGGTKPRTAAVMRESGAPCGPLGVLFHA